MTMIPSSSSAHKTSSISCVKFRPCKKGTLLGFADILLERTGIIIRDCPVHRCNAKEWLNFPARQYELDGVRRWQPLIEFAPGASAAKTAFQEQALAAVHAAVTAASS